MVCVCVLRVQVMLVMPNGTARAFAYRLTRDRLIFKLGKSLAIGAGTLDELHAIFGTSHVVPGVVQRKQDGCKNAYIPMCDAIGCPDDAVWTCDECHGVQWCRAHRDAMTAMAVPHDCTAMVGKWECTRNVDYFTSATINMDIAYGASR